MKPLHKHKLSPVDWSKSQNDKHGYKKFIKSHVLEAWKQRNINKRNHEN